MQKGRLNPVLTTRYSSRIKKLAAGALAGLSFLAIVGCQDMTFWRIFPQTPGPYTSDTLVFKVINDNANISELQISVDGQPITITCEPQSVRSVFFSRCPNTIQLLWHSLETEEGEFVAAQDFSAGQYTFTQGQFICGSGLVFRVTSNNSFTLLSI